MSLLSPSVLPGTKPLVRDYLARAGAVSRFFAHHPDDEGSFAAAAEARLAAYGVDRTDLVQRLNAQNRRWQCGEATLRNISRLSRDNAVAVVTGQQAGILGGPLFTVYKALTAILRAEELERELGRPCIPVFWLVGDDHDFAEIDHVSVPAEGGDGKLSYAPQEYRAGDSVLAARVEAGPWEAVMERLQELLPDTEFSGAAVWEALKEAYAPGTSLGDAFARLYHRLLEQYGIVMVDVTQDGLKELGRRVFETELADPGRSTVLADRAGAALREAGYHQQLTFDPANVNLFFRTAGERRKIKQSGNGFIVGQEEVAPDDMQRMLADECGSFSTGVVLRPVLQDTLLPTVAYVGGPGEVAYFAQLKDVYDAFGVPMPVICVRDGATLLEPKIMRIVKKRDLADTDLFARADDLIGRLLRRGDLAGFTGGMASLKENVTACLAELGGAAAAIDPSLKGTVATTDAKIKNVLDVLEKKAVAAAKRNSEQLRTQIARLHAHCLPGGTPQERVFTVLYYLNLFGPGLIATLYDVFRDEGRGHHIITL